MFCFLSVCRQAETQADAEDGIKFMQEMIELAKQRNDESGMKLSNIRTTIRITCTTIQLDFALFSLFLPRKIHFVGFL